MPPSVVAQVVGAKIALQFSHYIILVYLVVIVIGVVSLLISGCEHDHGWFLLVSYYVNKLWESV